MIAAEGGRFYKKKRKMKKLIFLTILILSTNILSAQDNYRSWIRNASNNDKLALVIGNTNYSGSNRLRYAKPDAELMTKTLEAQGYDVLIGYDLDQPNFKSILKKFAGKLSSYKQCVVYYAGHSFEEKGINYMVPIKANLNDSNLESESVTLTSLMGTIDNPSIPKLFLLDACRIPYRSFTNEERRAIQIRQNTLIIYSTVEGTRVKDNNPFAEELSKEMAKGGCIEHIFKKVSKTIVAANPDQLIWQEGSLQGEICFEEIEGGNDERGTFVDARDGQSYTWKKMKDGKKWMTENLNYKISDSYCYDDEESNCMKYGRLYTWAAAKKACPLGWRLPNDNDWKLLVTNYSGDRSKGKDIKDPVLSNKALISGGSSGFMVLLGGLGFSDGGYYYLRSYGYYWSAIELDADGTGSYYGFDEDDGVVSGRDEEDEDKDEDEEDETIAYSCRCLKD